MERLTERTRKGTAVPGQALEDVCLLFSADYCLKHERCAGCPINQILTRLCEYEDTGLTPEQIKKLKPYHKPKLNIAVTGFAEEKLKNANIMENIAKLDTAFKRSEFYKHKIQKRVSRFGILFRGKKYYLPNLVFNYSGRLVDIIVNDKDDTAYVYVDGTMVESFEL